MAYRSWLKDVKHVGDLGQQLVPLDYRKPDIDKRERLADKRWNDLHNREVPVATEFRRYFGSGMHDSWIVDHQRNEDEFSLTLHFHVADGFLFHFREYLNLEIPRILCPVKLKCHGTTLARWARTDPSGHLVWSRPDFTSTSEFDGSDMLIHDWFFQQQGHLQWIVHVHSNKEATGKLNSHTLFLMVDCSSVSAEDLVPETIRAKLGDKSALLWQEFWAQTDFLFCDQPQLFALFESVSKREGWTKNDLRQDLLLVPGANPIENVSVQSQTP